MLQSPIDIHNLADEIAEQFNKETLDYTRYPVGLSNDQIEELEHFVEQKVREFSIPKGKWNGSRCSICGKEAITEWNEIGGEHVFTSFCPNCGADMRGEEQMELISKEAVIDLINNPPLYLSLGGMSKEDLLKGIEELPIIEVECFGDIRGEE